MVEAQQVLEWIAEGEIKGQARLLLRFLELRFGPGLPLDLIAQIQATTDVEQLQRWFDAGYEAPSLDAFRQILLS